ncbi:MAG: TIGR02453 family protein [Gammaproteobacteria bacterium]|nr:TIGR02453 family protein [Gammaproteobacteria bacterium]
MPRDAQASFTGFEPRTLRFLRELADHNDRAWFKANKTRYETEVLEPAMRFIVAMEPHVRALSPHYRAIARRAGGSLMRVYRDVRFARDKRPYKTNIGIQFRHEQAKDVHAPGFYVHVAPGEVFVGAGCWHPDRTALGLIRDRIATHPDRWRAARDAPAQRRLFQLEGTSLTRMPQGYDAQHPHAVDLRRTDYLLLRRLDETAPQAVDFVDEVSRSLRAAVPLVGFLCRALNLPF